MISSSSSCCSFLLFRGANEFLDLRVRLKRWIKEIREGKYRGNRELVIGRMVAITIFQIFFRKDNFIADGIVHACNQELSLCFYRARDERYVSEFIDG